MMYPFMVLNDHTEIVHSEIRMADGVEAVKVYLERPTEHGFDSATCWLPDYRWEGIVGYSKEEIAYFQQFLESTAHIIYELAREGGFQNAASL